MNIKERWNKKTDLEKDSFEFLGEKVDIRALSGLEKIEVQEEKNKGNELESERLIYSYGMLTKELKLNNEEFNHAFDTSHAEIDYILGKILDVSGMTEEAQKSIEKN